MVLGKVLLHVLDWYRILTHLTQSDVTLAVSLMQLKCAYAYLPFAEGKEEEDGGRVERGRSEGLRKTGKGKGGGRERKGQGRGSE